MHPISTLVKIVWKDAHGMGSTTAMSLHEIPHGFMEITTYGLLLRQDEIGVSVACEVCADGTFRGYTFVPAGMLISVEPVLKTKTARKQRTNHPAAPEETLQTESKVKDTQKA